MCRSALLLSALLSLVSAASGQSRIFYANPDDAPARSAYLWNGSPVPSKKLHEVLIEASKLEATSPIEIRLTVQDGVVETIYRVPNAGSNPAFISIEGWRGSPNAQLIIRGQVNRTGPKPQALTTIEGRSLGTTLCSPRQQGCVHLRPQ